MKTLEKKYLSVVETAKLVRQALKEAFPGFRFSVRSSSYSGGASINIRWTDGPRQTDVDAVVNTFAGATFDGQTDYKGCRVHTMDGRTVSFGADFIFTDREYSEAFLADAMRQWDGLTAAQRCELLNNTLPRWGLDHGGDGLRPTARGMASTLSDIEPKASKTAESVVLVRVY